MVILNKMGNLQRNLIAGWALLNHGKLRSSFLTSLTTDHIKSLILVVLMTLLSGCGFHLRDDYLVPDELNVLSVTSYDQYSTLTRELKKRLEINDVQIVTPATNVPNLQLFNESISQRTLSVYQNTRAAEIELTMTTNYQVSIPHIGIKQFSTSVSRNFLDNPLTPLAKSVERDMIENEMRELTAGQIIRQLARLKPEFDRVNAVDQQMEPQTTPLASPRVDQP